MRQSNKLWTLGLIFIIITLLSATLVHAGWFDDIKTKASDGWDAVNPFITSKAFWINIAIIFGALFVVIQFIDQVRARFEGNREWILYALLAIISIFVAIKLGQTPIYSVTAIKWLFNWHIIINVVVVSIALYLVLQYIPESIAGPIRSRERGVFFSYFMPIIIALIIVHQVAAVSSTGDIGNDALIWDSKFWLKIEKFAVGDRAADKFGDWTGKYEVTTSEGQDTRYGILYWKKVEGRTIIKDKIKLMGKEVPVPDLPPIMIFLFVWMLTYLLFSITKLFQADDNMHFPKQARNILIIYLAILITSQGIEFATILLMFKIYLFIVLFQQINNFQDLSFITRFMLPYILSETVLFLFIQPAEKLNFEWGYTLLGFELAWQLWPIIWPVLKYIWENVLIKLFNTIRNWVSGAVSRIPKIGKFSGIIGLIAAILAIALILRLGPQVGGFFTIPLIKYILNWLGHLPFKLLGFSAGIALLGDKEKDYIKKGVAGFGGLALLWAVLWGIKALGYISTTSEQAISRFIIGLLIGLAVVILFRRKSDSEQMADKFSNRFDEPVQQDTDDASRRRNKLIKDEPRIKGLIALIVQMIKNGQSEKVIRAILKVKEMKISTAKKREELWRILTGTSPEQSTQDNPESDESQNVNEIESTAQSTQPQRKRAA